MSKKTIIVSSIVAFVALATSLFYTGCNWFSPDKQDDYMSYAAGAGKTVGYLVSISDKFIDPSVKTAVTNVVKHIVTDLPKDIAPDTVTNELYKISIAVVAEMEIDPMYKGLIDKGVGILMDTLRVGLDNLEKKYPEQFNNTEICYAIVFKFVDSVNSVFEDSIESVRGEYLTENERKDYEDLINELTPILSEPTPEIPKFDEIPAEPASEVSKAEETPAEPAKEEPKEEPKAEPAPEAPAAENVKEEIKEKAVEEVKAETTPVEQKAEAAPEAPKAEETPAEPAKEEPKTEETVQ